MLKYYRNLGYDVPRNGCEINVKISDIPKGSGLIIDCVCDVCGINKKMRYDEYNKSLKSGGYYTCQQCHHIKSGITNLEK